MTNEQELSLVKLYSAGVPYKVISDMLDVPVATLSSCIRRKYKDLQSQMQAKFRLLTENYTRKFMRELGVNATVAQAMFGNLYERFQNKRRNTKAKEFDIKFSDIEFTTHCPLLGIPLNYNQTMWKADDYPTFDRIDNTKGYVKGNVHIVSWRANRMKGTGSPEEWATLGESMRRIMEKNKTE
jgi:hypothetical protein